MEYLRTALTAPDSAIEALRDLDATDRLLGLYECAIEGCTRRDTGRVTAAVEELIGTLNFDYGELAVAFERLYRFWLERTRCGDFEQVAWSVSDLHDICGQTLRDAAAAPAGGHDGRR